MLCAFSTHSCCNRRGPRFCVRGVLARSPAHRESNDTITFPVHLSNSSCRTLRCAPQVASQLPTRRTAAAMMLFSATVAAAGTRRGLLQQLRPYSSALNGNRTPIDNVTKNTTAMVHQEDSSSHSTEEAFELRVPGVCDQGQVVYARCAGRGTQQHPVRMLLRRCGGPGGAQHPQGWHCRHPQPLCCSTGEAADCQGDGGRRCHCK